MTLVHLNISLSTGLHKATSFQGKIPGTTGVREPAHMDLAPGS